MTIIKFSDVDDNICYMQLEEGWRCFNVWTEESPNIVHKFAKQTVEEFLNRGIWKRLC